MAYADAPSRDGVGSARTGLAGLEAGVRALDPATRALLDLSLRRRLRDDDMAPLLRIDSFNLAWRRARAIERLASDLGLTDASGLAQVRAALPYVPERAWLVPPALPPGDEVVEGEAVTMEFDAVVPEQAEIAAHAAVPEHAWGPRALAVRPAAPPAPASPPAPRLGQMVRGAVARPGPARGALLAAGGALFGALLSRRRR
ncbi:MAG TPA: hypothetical protein VJT75_06175 [Thermoleophilaceae bacterium]|nr:hypothetical protein [Thermoleophilaceae bacterium]